MVTSCPISGRKYTVLRARARKIETSSTATNITLMASPVCEALQKCLAAPPGQSWVFDGRNSPQQSGCPTPRRSSAYKERDPQQPLPKMQVQWIWGWLMFRFFTSKHKGYMSSPTNTALSSDVTKIQRDINPNHCIVWFRFPHR